MHRRRDLDELSMMRLAMGHVARGLAGLREDGTVAPVLDEMQTRKELYELLGYTPGQQWNFPNVSVAVREPSRAD